MPRKKSPERWLSGHLAGEPPAEEGEPTPATSQEQFQQRQEKLAEAPDLEQLLREEREQAGEQVPERLNLTKPDGRGRFPTSGPRSY